MQRRLTHFLFFALTGCSAIGPADKIFVVVREEPGKVIKGTAAIEYYDGEKMQERKTNEFGFFMLSKDSLKRKEGFDSLVLRVRYNGSETSIYTNKFNSYYDVNLHPNKPLAEKDKIADMHYHLSLKAYNTLAIKYLPHSMPRNVNWLRVDTDKLMLYSTSNGANDWVRYNLHKDHNDKVLLKRYLERDWIRPYDGANNLVHASEATFPHMLEGNVYLAFNAISPFEHSVSNQWIKRIISSNLKTGASMEWLNRLGGRDHITHWENFRREYAMITSQDASFNNFHWHTLRRNEDLSLSELLDAKPVVINVVEGAHIFQDTYFPHAINYDLMDTLSKEKRELYSIIRNKACKRAQDGQFHKSVCDLFNTNQDARVSKKDSLTNWVLMQELLANIDVFKTMNVHMISISHLSYNGMTGHAPALDVSKVPPGERLTSYLAKRAFGIRVSKDRQYTKSYDGLFFRVPGPNIFGKAAISRLLEIKNPATDRFIHIDLKHSDVITRKYIMDQYDELSKIFPDRLRPVCSHCAVNGLSLDYYSPLLNEYSMLNSSLARKFYPFAINLFNEEVQRICESEGIIGIPLEERVLGGYINNRQNWMQGISGRGELKPKSNRLTRIKYMKRVFRYLDKHDNPEYDSVTNYYVGLLRQGGLYHSGTDPDSLKKQRDDLRKLIFREYCSAEPFLQNVFHIVDIARTTKRQIEMQKLFNIAKRTAVDERRSRNIDSVAVRGRKLRDELSKATPGKEHDSLRQQLRANTLRNLRDTTLHTAGFFYQDVNNQFRQMLSTRSSRDSLEATIRRNAWSNVCLGSDFDGMIDPIDICASASQYPLFKEKLKHLIPLFLFIRQQFEVKDKLLEDRYHGKDHYFNGSFTTDDALQMLFYRNLKEFTEKNFML